MEQGCVKMRSCKDCQRNRTRPYLKGFLRRIEREGLVTSPDAKAIVRNVNEILEERN